MTEGGCEVFKAISECLKKQGAPGGRVKGTRDTVLEERKRGRKGAERGVQRCRDTEEQIQSVSVRDGGRGGSVVGRSQGRVQWLWNSLNKHCKRAGRVQGGREGGGESQWLGPSKGDRKLKKEMEERGRGLFFKLGGRREPLGDTGTKSTGRKWGRWCVSPKNDKEADYEPDHWIELWGGAF